MTEGLRDVVLVLTTLPADLESANRFARTVVEERLAACVNVSAPLRSIYRWKGEVEEEDERQLTIKTTAARVQSLIARIQELHPYDVPEILVLPIADGGDAYLTWIRASTD